MLIDNFLEEYYNRLKENGINKVVIAPVSMIIENTKDEYGWFEWQPIESNLNRNDIKELMIKYKLPIKYLEYITKKQFMDIEIDGYKLFGINENNTFEKQIELFPKNIISFGFIPIGQINDEDFIALNVNSKEIVTLSYDNYLMKEVIYSDFNKLIEFLMKKL